MHRVMSHSKKNKINPHRDAKRTCKNIHGAGPKRSTKRRKIDVPDLPSILLTTPIISPLHTPTSSESITDYDGFGNLLSVPYMEYKSPTDSIDSLKMASLKTTSSKKFVRRIGKLAEYNFLIVQIMFVTTKRVEKNPYVDASVVRIDIDMDNENISEQFKLLDQYINIATKTVVIIVSDDYSFSNELEKSKVMILYTNYLKGYEKHSLHTNVKIYHLCKSYGYLPVIRNVKLNRIFGEVANVMIVQNGKPSKRTIYLIFDVYYFDKPLLEDERWWERIYFSIPYDLQGRLIQTSGTCWLNAILNIILLTPLANYVRKNLLSDEDVIPFNKFAKIDDTVSLKQLLNSLLVNILQKNIRPIISDGDIMLPIAARVKSMAYSYRNNEKLFIHHDKGIEFGEACEVYRAVPALFESLIDASHLVIIENNTRPTIHEYVQFICILDTYKTRIDKTKTSNRCGKKYDLMGSVIVVSDDEGEFHAICALIVDGKECIFDSHGHFVFDTWSNGTLEKYKIWYHEEHAAHITTVTLEACFFKRRNE